MTKTEADLRDFDPPTTAFVYLLRCCDGSLYCGQTTDVTRRLAEHQAGRGGRYTHSRLPCTLAASWELADRSAALRAEARIKRLPRKAKLKLLGAAELPPELWR